MGFFDGWKKRGRPRSEFSIEESEELIRGTIDEDPHIEVFWTSHKKISGCIFSIDVGFLSFSNIEKLLKHKNVRDVYFGPKRNDTGKLTVKLFYG